MQKRKYLTTDQFFLLMGDTAMTREQQALYDNTMIQPTKSDADE